MTTDLRHLLAIYVHAHQTGNSVPPHIDAEARAALADGPAAPAPPADGEVAELVAWLREQLHVCLQAPWTPGIKHFGRAADLLQCLSTPQSPADGEVEELVNALKGIAYWRRHNKPGGPAPAPFDIRQADRLDRAADLLEQQATAYAICERERLHQSTRAADLEIERHQPAPVPVSERLPRPSVKVLAHYFNGLGKGRTICAIWVPAKTRSDSYGDDDFTEYDEESDTFYWPEGWYETIENWDDLGYVKVDEGEVVYWQPLPKWPAHALPLPEVGE